MNLIKTITVSKISMFLGLALLFACAGAISANAQYGRNRSEPTRVILLKIDGIEGNFPEKDFEKQILISSWSTGLSYDSGENSNAFQDLHVVINKSKASADIFQMMVNSRSIPTMVLSVVEFPADKQFSPVVLFKLTLRGVRVTSYQMGGSENSENMDQMSFEYASGIYEGAGVDTKDKKTSPPKIEFTVPPKPPKVKPNPLSKAGTGGEASSN